MDNIRSTPSNGAAGSSGRNGSSNGSAAADNQYSQAMLAAYEQQMAALAGAVAPQTAAGMFGYNPFMMASLAGLTGGYPGLTGLGGVGVPDYQSALMAAMSSGFPAAALYSGMGYPGMPFPAATDYASALSAYSSLVSNSSMAAPTQDTHPITAPTAERLPASPAPSNSSRRSNATSGSRAPCNNSSRQNTPHSTTPTHNVADSNSSSHMHPKKARLSSPGKRKAARSEAKLPSTDTSSFYQGLTADEFDVNTHFKNSLGSLYDNGLRQTAQTTTSEGSATSLPSTDLHNSDSCLDLSVKSSSAAKSVSHNNEASPARRSVIQPTIGRSLTPPSMSLADESKDDSIPSTHSVSRSPPDQAHQSRPSYTSPYSTSATPATSLPSTPDQVSRPQYDALPNLKRLSEQLKTEKSDGGPKQPPSLKSRNVVSLLKHNKSLIHTADSKPKVRKVRKGKANVLDTSEELASPRKLTLEEERNEIKRKLERDVKHHSIVSTNRKQETLSREKLPGSNAVLGKTKRRRRVSQQQKASKSSGDIFRAGATTSNDAPKPKRTYIRTKIVQDKPVDMSKLAIPFEYGWRRETRLRGISKNGRMVGEVFYYTPTDKRMRSYNDVNKYMDAQRENYKLLESDVRPDDASDVVKPPSDGQPKQHNNTDHSIAKLTADDSAPPVAAVCNGWTDEKAENESSVTETKPPRLMANGRPVEWDVLTKDHFSFSTKVKLGDFMEQKPGEKYVLLNDVERDKRIQLSNEKRSKQLEKLNKLKAKKVMMKDTSRRLEQAKAEKELRQMQLVQQSVQAKLRQQLEKAKTKAQHELMKQQRAMAVQMRRQQLQEERDRDRLQKQERNKYLLEMRERQRLSLINSKIMETKRRDEERRRQQMEKIIQKERKQEIRKRQLELARELKQPVEDLKLQNLKALPTLNRIPGMKLPAGVFADVLQFHQFITNFYDCLEFKQSIPTLNTLQQALLCDGKHSKQALSRVLCHMLRFALGDPGVHNPNKFSNELGQKLHNCAIDEFNFSEVLRMFMLERDDSPTQLSRELETKPFNSLAAPLKSRAMAWLCDELNTSRAVTEDIDNNMDRMLNLRRDKWELEGKLRELRSSAQDGGKLSTKPKDSELSDQSDNDEDATNDQLTETLESAKTAEGKVETAEDKKLEKLTRQYSKCCKDVVTRSGTVRTFPYGMDRYRRYYWCLPSFKGLLVESHESSVHESASDPSDCSVTLGQLCSTSPESEVKSDAADNGAKQEVAEAKPSPQPDEAKSEGQAEAMETAVPALPISNSNLNTTHNKPTSSGGVSHRPPNGVNNSPHSIASWLCSTIDNIFTQQKPDDSSSRSSTSYPSVANNLTSSSTTLADSKSFLVLPSNAATASSSLDEIDPWFELGRKLPCDRLSRFSPQLVANSLAFMNCVTGSEEQKELEALERLAARAALLDKPKPLPTDLQKGWWIITDHEQVKSLSASLHQRAIREKILNRSLCKNKEKLALVCTDRTMCTDVEFECDARDSVIAQSSYHAPVSHDNGVWIEKQCRTAELSILDKVEDLEERVYQASIYTKNWADKKKHDPTDLELITTPIVDVKDGEKRIIDLIKDKLLLLEAGVERRYLKPPFIKSNALQLADIVSTTKSPSNGTADGSDTESETSEDKTNEDSCSKGLLHWQRAVRGAVNVSQLYIGLSQLESCIAWEKSVMRVLCQVCRSDDNEDQLLLCDSCDKGYHTYCFKPRMSTIPSGDWYCWECKSKATTVAHCIRCGKSTGRMAQCHKCPQAIHLDCTSPPLSRVPRKHTCGHCLQISNQGGKRKRLSKQQTCESSSSEDAEEEEGSGTAQETTDEEMDSQPADAASDLTECREIMSEIERHKDAQPFLEPVDTKAFPQYKKYIKQPMDLGKISLKLSNNQYQTRAEFYDDMILIFDNCLLFNEDSSDVGKSGKVLRRLFVKRWKQLTAV